MTDSSPTPSPTSRQLPGGLAEFEDTLPGLFSISISQSLTTAEEEQEKGEMTYENFVNYIKNNEEARRRARMLTFDEEGKLKGFHVGGQKFFQAIAHELRYLHVQSKYCGDLIHRVRIRLPRLEVVCRFKPMSDDFLNGVHWDVYHFRCMVAYLIKNLVEKTDLGFFELPLAFTLFFWSNYKARIKGFPMRNKVLEETFYQLYNPLFFGRRERFDFITMIVDYRKENPNFFDKSLGLNELRYGLDKWQDKIAADPILNKILKRTIGDNSRWVMMNMDEYGNIDYYYAILPRFLRNAHAHYADNDVRTLHGYYDCALNELLPGICSIIFDAILRNVNCSTHEMGHKLFEILGEPPNGFYFDRLLNIPLPGRRDGRRDGWRDGALDSGSSFSHKRRHSPSGTSDLELSQAQLKKRRSGF